MVNYNDNSSLSSSIHNIYIEISPHYVFSVASLISGNKDACHYLVESSSNYYAPEELKDILSEADFKQVSFRRLCRGAISIYTAIK